MPHLREVGIYHVLKLSRLLRIRFDEIVVIELLLSRQCALGGAHKILPAVAGLDLAGSSKGVYINLLELLVLQCNQVCVQIAGEDIQLLLSPIATKFLRRCHKF